MANSLLFTEAEFEALQRRLSGDCSDPTGIFSNRVRPKIKEILAFTTPGLRRQLKKALKQVRVTGEDGEV